MKKLKVAIIGAGPSGFAVAEVLRSKPYADRFDCTIYEKNNYVGGKCCTVFEDGTICNDKGGGYEMGATLLTKHTPSYADLRNILDKYDVAVTNHKEISRQSGEFLRNGRPVDVKRLNWPQFRLHPRRFFRTLLDYDHYVSDYIKYRPSRHAGYTNRPQALYKPLSHVYSRAVQERLAYFMQGFGYADLDDKHLTPALLYFHQYIELEAAGFPMYHLDNGMQGIWARIAKTYPRGSIRLNQHVRKVSRSPNKVSITTPHGTEEYDYLVVATPLKPALEYLDLDKRQKKFLGRMKHNHYVSVLCRAKGLEAIGTFNIPACTNKKNLGQVVLGYKRYPNSDYITVYLYIKKGRKSDDQTVIQAVEKSLRKDLHTRLIESQKAKVFHWNDYFGHLSTKDLKAGWYEKFETEFQGKDRTLFVSSGLHMETVGASVQYGTREARKYATLWSKT